MELSDEIVINAPKAKVYAALNDPAVLQQCIPGCEELMKHSDTELEALVVLKIGPVKAKFSGNVQLDTAGAPDMFSLTGQGNGGAAGHAGWCDHPVFAGGKPRQVVIILRQACSKLIDAAITEEAQHRTVIYSFLDLAEEDGLAS